MTLAFPVRDVGYATDALQARIDELDSARQLCGGITVVSSTWQSDGPERIVLDGRIRVLVADISRLAGRLRSVHATIHPAEQERVAGVGATFGPVAGVVMSGTPGFVTGVLTGSLWSSLRPVMSTILSEAPTASAIDHDVRLTAFPATTATAPLSLADRVSRIPRGDTHIRIERYVDDGGNRFEVYLSGTNFLGGSTEPWNFASNIELAVTGSSPALIAVRHAMASAGITRNTPVVLTGHSQGGLIALELAGSGSYRVDGIVTVGSPVGLVDDVDGVPTIHLVHPTDPVPAAGGVIDPRSFTWVIPEPHGETFIDAHDRDTYILSAHTIDELEDPRVTTILESMRSKGIGVSRDYNATTTDVRNSP